MLAATQVDTVATCSSLLTSDELFRLPSVSVYVYRCDEEESASADTDDARSEQRVLQTRVFTVAVQTTNLVRYLHALIIYEKQLWMNIHEVFVRDNEQTYIIL